jgi:hypothetical protein
MYIIMLLCMIHMQCAFSLSLSLSVHSLGFSLVSWHFFRFASAARHLIGRFRTRLIFSLVDFLCHFCTRLIFIGRFPVPKSTTLFLK